MKVFVGFVNSSELESCVARLPSGLPVGTKTKGCWLIFSDREAAAQTTADFVRTGACFDVVVNE